MSIDYDKLTDEIMQGMSDSTGESSGLGKHILKTEIGDTILCRFLLFKPSPKDSVYHYFHHGWRTSSGQYVSYLCPSTSNETCPICRKSINFWKSNNPFLVEASKKIRRKENWMVNVYVIDDAKHPENNGKVKLFRFGKQIKTIIDEATTGVDKDIFGKNIWRLDEKGCNFRITVKPNSDKKDAWPSYTASKFLPPSDLGLSDEQVRTLLDSAFDMTKLYDRQLSYEELSAELQKYFIDDLQRDEAEFDENSLGTFKKTTQSREQDESSVQKELSHDDDDLDYSSSKSEEDLAESGSGSQKADTSSDEIDRMLEELG